MTSLQERYQAYKPLEALCRDIKNDRLAHAYLFLALADDAWSCVKAFASALECESGLGEVCGACRVCQQIENEKFIDLLRFVPSGKANLIKLEDIQTLQEMVQTKPMVASKRLCFVQDVQYMDKEAANAFLKILEEPPVATLFVLSAPNPHEILGTIVSRCRRVVVASVDVQSILQKDLEGLEEIKQELWLILQGAPQDAVSLAVDRINEQVHQLKNNEVGNKIYLEAILEWVMLIQREALVWQQTSGDTQYLLCPEFVEEISLVATVMSEGILAELQARIEKLRANIFYNMNLKLSLSYLFSPVT
jgi:hypothetical protein